jgi:hypothetical protein
VARYQPVSLRLGITPSGTDRRDTGPITHGRRRAEVDTQVFYLTCVPLDSSSSEQVEHVFLARRRPRGCARSCIC